MVDRVREEPRRHFDLEPSASMAPVGFDAAGDEVDDAPPDYDADEQAGLYLDLGMDDARGALADAIEARRRCAIADVKPGAAAPEERVIEPYTLVYGEGQWYVIAMDRGRGALRVFRLDRILDARLGDESFEPAADFDAARFLGGGAAPFLPEQDVEVTVRYAPAIARWITERTGVAPEHDGSVLLRHRVADARWLIRHVLQYGGAATIHAAGNGLPAEPWRALVAEAAERVADRL
jgi:hypothetical protein